MHSSSNLQVINQSLCWLLLSHFTPKSHSEASLSLVYIYIISLIWLPWLTLMCLGQSGHFRKPLYFSLQLLSFYSKVAWYLQGFPTQEKSIISFVATTCRGHKHCMWVSFQYLVVWETVHFVWRMLLLFKVLSPGVHGLLAGQKCLAFCKYHSYIYCRSLLVRTWLKESSMPQRQT